jgi:hypothetical protein
MIILLLDESLRVQIFYEDLDAEFKDNICISFQEDCPDEEKIFKVDETNIFLTPEQAQELADALNTAATQSKLATRTRQINERRFDGDVDRLRSIERRNLLEVDHVVDSAMETIQVKNILDVGTVLHETDDPEQTLREARRVARKRVVVLEWPYKAGEIGPPLEHRLSPDEIKILTRNVGFPEVESIELANTVLYCMKA